MEGFFSESSLVLVDFKSPGVANCLHAWGWGTEDQARNKIANPRGFVRGGMVTCITEEGCFKRYPLGVKQPVHTANQHLHCSDHTETVLKALIISLGGEYTANIHQRLNVI